MSAAPDLLRYLQQSGIRLQPRGDRLHVEAARGKVTPELRLILAENKAELLAALSTDAVRARLARLADSLLIDPATVSEMTDRAVEECRDFSDDFARAYLRAMSDSALRAKGRRPSDETAAALCNQCGPIWLAPEVAAVAPMREGWPLVLGCPWCHVKNRRVIPRPSVACESCRHFKRDAINPGAGIGRCAVGVETNPLPYPTARRECHQFQPRGTAP